MEDSHEGAKAKRPRAPRGTIVDPNNSDGVRQQLPTEVLIKFLEFTVPDQPPFLLIKIPP